MQGSQDHACAASPNLWQKDAPIAAEDRVRKAPQTSTLAPTAQTTSKQVKMMQQRLGITLHDLLSLRHTRPRLRCVANPNEQQIGVSLDFQGHSCSVPDKL